jgi:hypothetical protein
MTDISKGRGASDVLIVNPVLFLLIILYFIFIISYDLTYFGGLGFALLPYSPEIDLSPWLMIVE